jgi:hypothetical protein
MASMDTMSQVDERELDSSCGERPPKSVMREIRPLLSMRGGELFGEASTNNSLSTLLALFKTNTP